MTDTPDPTTLLAENARLRATLVNARAFVADELAVRIDSHTLGGDLSTIDESEGGIIGEAQQTLAMIDRALEEGAPDLVWVGALVPKDMEESVRITFRNAILDYECYHRMRAREGDHSEANRYHDIAAQLRKVGT
jgi:hypothetical protein